ncbi:peroxiredoxin family protein [Natrononativus amylolyticus]|uniref:peroxiredoxin family protein n=1 Tax=Natrononativus amylolyticus TaxID=2963434 RepID=UPI0020CC0AE6|nr:redoxin domain-containing protein [Natrononativus amylolyticus]
MTSTDVDFALPNVGPGPDPLRLSALAASVEPADPTTGAGVDPAYDAAVVLLQRDHYCGNCRRQVRAVADRYDEFRERRAEVVSIVPESRETVERWQASYDLPFPLCADPETVAGEAFDQPVRLGPLGRLSDLIGRMPVAVVLDLGAPEEVDVASVHRGSSRWDRPEIDELLAELEALE